MTKKSPKFSTKKEYALGVQDLMNAIPTSTVAKIIDGFDDEDGPVYRSVKWVVDGYAVYSELRNVHSIDPDGNEEFAFILKAKDYNEFVKACKARRAEIHKQITVKKK